MKKIWTLGFLIAMGILALSVGCKSKDATTTTETTSTREVPAPSGTPQTTTTTTTTYRGQRNPRADSDSQLASSTSQISFAPGGGSRRFFFYRVFRARREASDAS